MSTSNPKYQIKIVKAGIGDPMLTIQFQFTNSDGTYTLPSQEHPVHDLEIQTRLVWLNGDGESISANTGVVSVNEIGTTDLYNMTVPFDMPSGFTMSNDVSMNLTVVAENGNTDVDIQNGDGNTISTAMTFFNPYADYADLYVQYEYIPS